MQDKKIPETRQKTVDGAPNAYYEGYLKDDDANQIAGFDKAILFTRSEFFTDPSLFISILIDHTESQSLKRKLSSFSEEEKIALLQTLDNIFCQSAEIKREEEIINRIECMTQDEIDAAFDAFEAGKRNAVLSVLKDQGLVNENGEYLLDDDGIGLE